MTSHPHHVSNPPFDGAPVRMGGLEWVVPALNFRQLKNLGPKLAKLGTVAPNEEGLARMDDVAEVVHAALSRNYPDLTLDDVAEMLDLSNVQNAVAAVVGQSGLVSKGEATAA